jgi:hypothetical protein
MRPRSDRAGSQHDVVDEAAADKRALSGEIDLHRTTFCFCGLVLGRPVDDQDNMSHVLGEQDARSWAWPPVGQVDEPLRTPLWLIRTLATALAAETDEHHQHVARQIARTAEQLEQSLSER